MLRFRKEKCDIQRNKIYQTGLWNTLEESMGLLGYN
jgi:hypothetical protein